MKPQKIPDKMTDSQQWRDAQKRLEAMRNRYPAGIEQPTETLHPQPAAHELDLMHNRHMLGGPTVFDNASISSPVYRPTQAAEWLTRTFARSGRTFAVLFGDTGSGKTWAALCYANITARVQFNLFNQKVISTNARFITATDLANKVHNLRRHEDDLQSLERRHILIIDELGTEPPGFRGDDFLAHLFGIISKRHMGGLKTIITTNLTPAVFREVYGYRVTSRIRESGYDFTTTDPDFRVQAATTWKEQPAE